MSSTTPTFTSRVWFITGTSSGLGKALTEVLLEKGDRVVATARKTETLAALQKAYPASQLLVAKLDVTDKAQIDAAFDAALKAFGQVDIVVNNAGYAVFGEIESISEEDARKQFEVQFWGPVNVMKRVSSAFLLADFLRSSPKCYPDRQRRYFVKPTRGAYSTSAPLEATWETPSSPTIAPANSVSAYTIYCSCYEIKAVFL